MKTRTGKLTDTHDNMMMHSLICWMSHPVPAKLAFEMDFFLALAVFAAAPQAVCADDAESICMMVANAFSVKCNVHLFTNWVVFINQANK